MANKTLFIALIIATAVSFPTVAQVAKGAATFHPGSAFKFFAGERFYIRPEIRYHYVNGVQFGFKKDEPLHIIGASVAAGWTFK